MTRREFFKSKEMKKIRESINVSAYLGYAIALAGVILNYVNYKTLNTLLDAVIIVTACLCIQFLQSRIASIVLGSVIVSFIFVLRFIRSLTLPLSISRTANPAVTWSS